MEYLCNNMPNFVGGSADTGSTTKTLVSTLSDISSNNYNNSFSNRKTKNYFYPYDNNSYKSKRKNLSLKNNKPKKIKLKDNKFPYNLKNTYTKDELRVYYGTKKLTVDADYSLKYSANTKAGTASLTITGKGNYAGTLVKNFNIEPADIFENDAVLMLSADTFTANGKAQKPSVTVEYHGIKLDPKKDYTLTYGDTKST